MPATIDPVKAWLKTVDAPKQIEAASHLLHQQWQKLRRQRWLATLKSVYVGDPVVPVASWPNPDLVHRFRDLPANPLVVVRLIERGKQPGVWVGVRGHDSWHNPVWIPGREFDQIEFRYRVPGEG
jgi:hypothetical protein